MNVTVSSVDFFYNLWIEGVKHVFPVRWCRGLSLTPALSNWLARGVSIKNS